MQHIDISAVEAKAAEFRDFSERPELDAATAADYAKRAADLFAFAKDLRRWR